MRDARERRRGDTLHEANDCEDMMISTHHAASGAPAVMERALIPVGGTGTRDLVPSDALTTLLDDTFAGLDQEIRAARFQIARGAHEFAEGMVRLAIALIKMRTRKRYLDAGYAGFAAYLQECHALSEDTALDCIQDLETLGADDYRDLLVNVGVMRTHTMTIIKRMAPQQYAELMAPGTDGGFPTVVGMDANALETLAADLKSQLAESYTHYDEVLSQLMSAKQIVTRTGERIAHVEKINQSLVVERDRIAQERDEFQKRQKSAPKADPKVVRDLKMENKGLHEQLAAATAALKLARSTPPPQPAVMAIMQDMDATCDPALLADLLRFCVTALERYRERAPHIALEHAQAFTDALTQMIAASDLALLTPVIEAVATALRRVHSIGSVDTAQMPALVAALDALGAAGMPIYEQRRRDGRP